MGSWKFHGDTNFDVERPIRPPQPCDIQPMHRLQAFESLRRPSCARNDHPRTLPASMSVSATHLEGLETYLLVHGLFSCLRLSQPVPLAVHNLEPHHASRIRQGDDKAGSHYATSCPSLYAQRCRRGVSEETAWQSSSTEGCENPRAGTQLGIGALYRHHWFARVNSTCVLSGFLSPLLAPWPVKTTYCPTPSEIRRCP
jgi:hypothetical protein